MSWLSTLPAAGWSWAGAVVGALVGVGLFVVLVRLPAFRRPGLIERIEPYLRDTPRPSRLLTRDTGSVVGISRIFRPLLTDLGALVERMLGGATSVRRRLLRAGQPPDVERFRAEQVVWGAVGALIGLVLGVLAIRFRGAGALPVVLLVVCFAGAGLVTRDYWLTRAANERERRMLAEFPTIAELLALAVSAGEGAIGALDRVCRLSRGELSSELGACLAEARAGANLPTALQGLAERTGLPSLARFVDGIVVAVERGTPLAEVLRAQAQDVRESSRRAVMEEGGRKEITMMITSVNLYLFTSWGGDLKGGSKMSTAALKATPRESWFDRGDAQVVWRENNELGFAMHWGNPDWNLPQNAEGGIVVVALEIDGNEFNEVHTDPVARVGNLQTVEKAIAALELVRDGIRGLEATR